MSARVDPNATHRKCKKCGETKPLESFAISRSNTLGRVYMCRPCKRDYARAWAKAHPNYKSSPLMVRPPEPAVPVPAMDLQQQLDCVRFRKWRYPVTDNRPLRATIRGVYV